MCGCNPNEEQEAIEAVDEQRECCSDEESCGCGTGDEGCGCGGNCSCGTGNVVPKISAGAFLIKTGLLFQINRDILHPVGLALEAEEDDNGDFILKNLWDLRNDPEGVVYSPEAFERAQRKLDHFYETFGNAKIKEREEVLGYVYQGQHQVSFTK